MVRRRSTSYGHRNPLNPLRANSGRDRAQTSGQAADEAAKQQLCPADHLVTYTVIDVDRLTTQPGAGSALSTVQLEATQTDL